MKPDDSAYAAAGVDIEAGDRAVRLIKDHIRSTFGPQVLGDVGAFGSLFHIRELGQNVLVASVDGVGTKLKVASRLGRYDTVGIDLVHHCVNDILTCGAEPLFFLDYIAVSKLIPEQVESIVQGLAGACRQIGCALIGGETAELPGIYIEGEFDLAGFIVGMVDKEKIIEGKSITAGDAIIGLPSSGLHTNGYSLVRKVFELDETSKNENPLNIFYSELNQTLGEELLEPHRCYYTVLKPVLPYVKGMAHITGGGLVGNVPRVLPEGLGARFYEESWQVPPIFPLVQRRGGISLREMYRVFNMGIGMALVCQPEHIMRIIQTVAGAKQVGEVIEYRGENRVVIESA